jgi:hypothetical protein
LNLSNPFLPPNPLYPRASGGAGAEGLKKRILIIRSGHAESHCKSERDPTNFSMNKKCCAVSVVIGILSLILSSCGAVVELGGTEEFLRVSKIDALEFQRASEVDVQRIANFYLLHKYDYRIAEYRKSWTVARDGDYLIYRGSAAETSAKLDYFVVVWSLSADQAVFAEVGHTRVGEYPRGLLSSP